MFLKINALYNWFFFNVIFINEYTEPKNWALGNKSVSVKLQVTKTFIL